MRLPWMRRRAPAVPLDENAAALGGQAPGPLPGPPGEAAAQPSGTSAPGAGPDISGMQGAPDSTPAESPAPAPAPTHRTPAEAMAAASAEVLARPPYAGAPESPPVVTMPHAGQPQRRGLIPSWVPWAAGGTVVAILLIALLAVVLSRSSVVRVPSVAGLDRKAAETRLSEVGLTLVVGDHRFSANAPVGTVIDQSPKAGAQLEEGSAVTVALSGGSEIFSMPDILGQTLEAARTALRQRGLTVEFQTAASDKQSGTVISSIPSPGQQVQTGDTVRLTIAAGTTGGDTLLPANLNGQAFVLDPAPMPAGSGADVTLDVALRLRALLEASGARVVITRSVTDTGDAAGTLARAKRAKESTAAALVGFSVTQSGVSGVAVASMANTATAPGLASTSATLAQAVLTALKTPFPNASTTTANNDTIVNDTGVPAIRVRLGSSQSGTDRLSFTDPQWADRVAKAVYRGIGGVFGAK